jgi:transposase
MPGPLSKVQMTMSDQTRVQIQSWLRCPTMPSGLVRRARAVLLLEQGGRYAPTARQVGLSEFHLRKWARRFGALGIAGLRERPRSGRPPVFPPEVALYVVKLACERPDHFGRSLSQWQCSELARQLQADGIVASISFETVRQILHSHKLKPWRSHLWLSPTVPRDQRFAEQVKVLVELYTRPLPRWERVLCLDEKTNLQPRPRLAPTKPTRPGLPTRVEHEYKRAGALHLLAAFDTRTGKVTALTALRKRQEEFISLLATLDRETPAEVKRIFLVLDNASIHKGKRVRAWLAAHPRFHCHFLPAHCSWMNQIEQWFSIVERKRLQISDFSDRTQLADRLMSFVAQWNTYAHPFNWSLKSATKVMAQCDSHPPQATAA